MRQGLERAVEIIEFVGRSYSGQGPSGEAEETSFAEGLRLGWKNACAETKEQIKAEIGG